MVCVCVAGVYHNHNAAESYEWLLLLVFRALYFSFVRFNGMRLSTTWNWFLVAFISWAVQSIYWQIRFNRSPLRLICAHCYRINVFRSVSFCCFFCLSKFTFKNKQSACFHFPTAYNNGNSRKSENYLFRPSPPIYIFVFLCLYSFQKTVTHFAVVVLHGATSPATKHKKLKRFPYFGRIWCSCFIGLRMYRSLIVWVSRCRVSRWDDTWRNVAFSQWAINT